MNKKWQEILNVKTLKSDKQKWGLFPIKRIERNFALNNDTELPVLKSFIAEEIKLLEHEIKHFKKWSPLVYHKNVSASRSMEKRTLEIVLKRINKYKK